MKDWNPLALVPVLDASGHAIPDPSGTPLMVNGKPVLVPILDANGNPVTKNNVIQYTNAIAYLMQTEQAAGIAVGRVLEPVRDANGNPVPLTDASGHEVLLLDASGNPIPVHDLKGNPVVDVNGNPEYQVQYKLQISSRSPRAGRTRAAVTRSTSTVPGPTPAARRRRSSTAR
jgi:hypothetical protein